MTIAGRKILERANWTDYNLFNACPGMNIFRYVTLYDT